MKFIVIADDDVDDCVLFKMEALKETIPDPPFVIFLDLNMPGKNGFECLKEIRINPQYESIPVVIFSTSKNENAINTTYSLGANYYIVKPHRFEILKETIEKIITMESRLLQQRPSRDQYLFSVN